MACTIKRIRKCFVERIQKYLDNSHARGELPKRLSVSDMFDFTLLKNLK